MKNEDNDGGGGGDGDGDGDGDGSDEHTNRSHKQHCDGTTVIGAVAGGTAMLSPIEGSHQCQTKFSGTQRHLCSLILVIILVQQPQLYSHTISY